MGETVSPWSGSVTFCQDPSPAELWVASLEEGDTVAVLDTEGQRVATAVVTLATSDGGTMMLRRPKACDISDEAFMAALEPDGRWSMWDAVTARLGFPPKVVLAKARILIERRLTVHGCACGCRGDWHRADECRDGC